MGVGRCLPVSCVFLLYACEAEKVVLGSANTAQHMFSQASVCSTVLQSDDRNVLG